MNNDEIRRSILHQLHDRKFKRREPMLLDDLKLPNVSKVARDANLGYLREKHLLRYAARVGGMATCEAVEITARGIDMVENEQKKESAAYSRLSKLCEKSLDSALVWVAAKLVARGFGLDHW